MTFFSSSFSSTDEMLQHESPSRAGFQAVSAGSSCKTVQNTFFFFFFVINSISQRTGKLTISAELEIDWLKSLLDLEE